MRSNPVGLDSTSASAPLIGDLESCLESNDLAALIEGGLGGRARADAEGHVDRCRRCRKIVVGLAREALSSGEAPTIVEQLADSWLTTLSEPTMARDLLVEGEWLDHFQIERLLGRGGMGEVYLAHDSKLERRVAIKRVHDAHLHSRRALDQFMLEARTTARLNHPHIVTVHAVGEHDGKPYLALEYIAGRSMRTWLRDCNHSLDEGLRIASDIAGGLAEAHRHGILHRDLKPENVLIGDDGRVRVVDFGLAIDIGPELDEESGARWVGVAGTPRYMAPEQWRSDSMSGAVDVWALGVILYEVASGGRHPFGYDRSDVTICDLVTAVALSETPVLPLPVEARVSPALSTLIGRCLAREASARPTAHEVRVALNEILAAPRPRARSAWHRVVLAAGLAAFVGVGIGSAGEGAERRPRAVDAGASEPVTTAVTGGLPVVSRAPSPASRGDASGALPREPVEAPVSASAGAATPRGAPSPEKATPKVAPPTPAPPTVEDPDKLLEAW